MVSAWSAPADDDSRGPATGASVSILCGGWVRLTFLGVRGSTPSPGSEFVRYGGHTSCVAVAHGPDEVPTLMLDAGTGLRNLGSLLGGAAYRGSILLSHLHWDHVQGLPFSPAVDRADSRVDLFLPTQAARSGRDLLAQLMGPPAFPITPDGLAGAWSFSAIPPVAFTADGFEITPVDVAHKGGRTYGYRVSSGGVSVGYLPDHSPAAGVSARALEVLAGVDLLIHDAQFVESERARALDYSHATIADAVALAHQVGAASLALFHHGPHRTDDALDLIAEAVVADIPVVVARQGMTVNLVGADERAMFSLDRH